MLLAVSSLGKQDLILGLSWLKEHNTEVNWKKEEVKIMYYSLRYNDCRRQERWKSRLLLYVRVNHSLRFWKRIRSYI